MFTALPLGVAQKNVAQGAPFPIKASSDPRGVFTAIPQQEEIACADSLKLWHGMALDSSEIQLQPRQTPYLQDDYPGSANMHKMHHSVTAILLYCQRRGSQP